MRGATRNIVVGVIAFVLGGAGGVFAAGTIPGPGGVINGCYQKNNGQLRVVADASQCLASELAISWNQTGTNGTKGDTGATGPIGATGAQGPMGATGAAGTAGTPGATGAGGATGPQGTKGDTGAQGPVGSGGAPSNFSDLIGIACNTGAAAGTLAIAYGPPPAQTVSLVCNSTITYALAVTLATSGGATGTVTSTPAGVSCPTTCSATFTNGVTVQLVATAASGSRFMGWSGACTGFAPCTVAMTAARSVTATFEPGFNLTITARAEASYYVYCGAFNSQQCPVTVSGKVLKQNELFGGTLCDVYGGTYGSTETCVRAFAPGTSVPIQVVQVGGSSWSFGGDCTGTAVVDGICTLLMDRDHSVTVDFR